MREIREKIWKEIFETISKMANGDNLEGWDFEGIRQLFLKIKKLTESGKKQSPELPPGGLKKGKGNKG